MSMCADMEKVARERREAQSRHWYQTQYGMTKEQHDAHKRNLKRMCAAADAVMQAVHQGAPRNVIDALLAQQAAIAAEASIPGTVAET